MTVGGPSTSTWETNRVGYIALSARWDWKRKVSLDEDHAALVYWWSHAKSPVESWVVCKHVGKQAMCQPFFLKAESNQSMHHLLEELPTSGDSQTCDLTHSHLIKPDLGVQTKHEMVTNIFIGCCRDVSQWSRFGIFLRVLPALSVAKYLSFI